MDIPKLYITKKMNIFWLEVSVIYTGLAPKTSDKIHKDFEVYQAYMRKFFAVLGHFVLKNQTRKNEKTHKNV